MKKLLCMILSLTMMFSIFATTPLTASAEAYEKTIDGIIYKIDTTTDEACVADADTSITIANIQSTVDGYAVTSVGDNAFYNCNLLTSATIPDSVTSVEYRAFYNCNSLTSINVSENNQNFSSENGILFDKHKTELIQYPIGKTDEKYIIPNSVISISGNAFSGCTSLAEFTIPDSVMSIGYNAFYNTAYSNDEANWENGVLYIDDCLIATKRILSLIDCTIKDGTRVIAESSFLMHGSLTKVTIPDSVISIGHGAFAHCLALTKVTIPDSVTIIGINAFGYQYAGNKRIKNFTIYGNTGSAAETYANENEFSFVSVGESQSTTTTEPTTATTTQPTITQPTSTEEMPTTTEPTTAQSTTAPTTQSQKGDCNGDGKVSVADARKLVVAIAKGDTIALLEFGDVNGDGKISVADARKIVVAIAKNDFSF